MRILRVSGRNLASLAGDFEVDFEAGPLAGASLFAITGPTGAGKSTLLDAVCLALFDRLPRMAGADLRATVGRADEVAALHVRYNDVRGMLRHGTAEGHASVDFVGQDGRRYSARWQVRRARNRPGGALQDQTLTLVDADTGQRIGDKKTDTLQAIQERVGLDFEQFRRAVLLAQGEFDNFIRADARERSELLERITGSQLYAQLSRAAFERAKSEQVEIDRLQQQLGMRLPMDEQARAAAEQELQDARARAEQLAGRRDVLARAAQWFVQSDRLAEMLAKARDEQAEAHEVDAGAAQDREALEVGTRAFGLRAEIEAVGRAQRQVRRYQEEAGGAGGQLAVVEREYAGAVEAEKTARERCAEARDAYDRVGPHLTRATELDTEIRTAGRETQAGAEALEIARRDLDTLIETKAGKERELDTQRRAVREKLDWLQGNGGAGRLREQLDVVTADIGSLAKLDGDIRTSEEKARSCEQAAQAAHAARREVEDRIAGVKSAVSVLEQRAAVLQRTLAGCDRPALLRARDAAVRMKTATGEALRADRQLARIAATCHERARQHEAALLRERSEQETVARLDAEIPAGAARSEEARRALRLSEVSIGEEAEHLRARLQPGQPCPVCGATEHPAGGDDSALRRRFEADRQRSEQLDAQLQRLRADRERAVAGRETAMADAVRLVRERSDLERERLEWNGSRAAAVAAIATAATETAIEISEAAAAAGGEAAEAELGRIEDASRAKLKELDAALAARDDAEEQRERVQVELEEERRRLQELGDDSAGLERERSDNAATAQAVRAGLAEKEAARRAVARRLDAVLASLANDWRVRLERDAAEFRRWCERQAELWVRTQEEHRLAQSAVDGLAADVREASVRAEEAGSAAAKAESAHAAAAEKLQALLAERAGVIGGRPVVDVRTQHHERVAEAERQEKSALARSGQASATLTEVRTRRDAALSSLRDATTELEEGVRSLERRLAEAGLSRPQAEAALARGPQWLESERRRLDAIRLRVTTAAATVQERGRAVAEHEAAGRPEADRDATQADLEAVERAWAEANERYADALASIKADDETRAAAGELQCAVQRRSEQARVWQELNELIGSSDGAKFRRFVQTLTLAQLLHLSNRHLADLAPRYRLERAPGGDLALQVVDRDMGDEVRGVHNLSGGERFLVSLSLALGLASMSSGHGTRVDTLFIDEGFGALDSGSLSLAVSALEALQATGRKVGVISHVDELKERIGVQVRLVPCGGGRSRVEVVGI